MWFWSNWKSWSNATVVLVPKLGKGLGGIDSNRPIDLQIAVEALRGSSYFTKSSPGNESRATPSNVDAPEETMTLQLVCTMTRSSCLKKTSRSVARGITGPSGPKRIFVDNSPRRCRHVQRSSPPCRGACGVRGATRAVWSWGFWQPAVVTQTTIAGWTCSGLGMWRSTRGLSGMPPARAAGKPLALARGLSGVPLAVSGGRTEGRPAAASLSFNRRRGPGGVGSVDLAATSGLRPRRL